jgi:hypothetical protein
MQLTVSGHFRREVSLDDQGWLRLEVFKRSDRGFNFASRISVAGQARAPQPETLDELAAAILGVHEAQWLKELPRTTETASGKIKTVLPGIRMEALGRFLARWDRLDSEVAAELWRIARSLASCSSPDGTRQLPEKVAGAAAQLAEDDLVEVLAQLRDHAQRELVPAGIEHCLKSLSGFGELDGWVRKQLTRLFGPIQCEADLDRLAESLRAVLSLRDSIYEKAVAALERKLAAEVSYLYGSTTQETALLDCSFNLTEEGLRAYRRALAGDYSGIFGANSDHLRLHHGVFTHGLRGETHLELHLPFLCRKEWPTRLEVLARMQVESDEDGRLLVYHAEASNPVSHKNSYQSTLALVGGLSIGRVHSKSNFTLAYTEKRRLPAASAGSTLAPALRGYGFDDGIVEWLDGLAEAPSNEASLSLSIPGSLVAAWLDAPSEDAPTYFRVYSQVSLAVQRAMRNWLPYVYFAGLDRYDTLGAAFPLLVYQTSRPFQGKPKNDFTYDVLSPDGTDPVFRTSAQALPVELRRVERLLLASGKTETAEFYNPKQAPRITASVKRQPRLLHALLVADTFLVDALVNLGCRGSRLREEVSRDPQKAVRDLTKFSGEFVRAFHGKLKRLYGGQDFLSLGSLLLVEATNALGAAMSANSAIQAVLHITRCGEGQPHSVEQTFVNSAFQPR